MRLELLRSSYRLSPETYERPHRLAREAATKIGVDVPIILYQLHQGEHANAGLCFTPDEAHVVISGPLLASLDDAELIALFGHELAHHRLWTLEDGAFHTVAELVEASATHAGAGTAHPTPMSLIDYVWPGGAANTFTIGMNTKQINRYAYTMAPLIFAPMLLIAEKVLGRPSADAVYAAFEA